MALIGNQEVSPQLLDALLRGDNPSLSGPSQRDLIAAIMRGDFGDQTSRWAEQAANPYWGFGGRPGNLTAEQLALLRQGIVPEGYAINVGGYESRGDQGIDSAMDPYYVLTQGMEDPTWGTAKANAWDLDGNYLGYSSADSELRGLVKAAAIAAAMYGGASYGAGTGGEGAAGTSGGAATTGGSTLPASSTTAYGAGGSSITLPTTAEMAAGMTPASASTAAASMPVINTAASGAAGAAATAGTNAAMQSAAEKAATSAATQAALDSMRGDERAGYQTDGRMPSSPASTSGNMDGWDTTLNAIQQFLGNGAGNDPNSWANIASRFLGGNAGGLLGAYLGYQDSKDGKQITSQTAPWSEAQPYIKGLLGAGANVWDQYQQQPFSQPEQVAYSNMGNTLDFINANADRFMSGFDATAAGRNQFSRNAPRRGLIGNSYDAATSPVAWQPGLLNGFGTSPSQRSWQL
jgi:hypothetical protein